MRRVHFAFHASDTEFVGEQRNYTSRVRADGSISVTPRGSTSHDPRKQARDSDNTLVLATRSLQRGSRVLSISSPRVVSGADGGVDVRTGARP